MDEKQALEQMREAIRVYLVTRVKNAEYKHTEMADALSTLEYVVERVTWAVEAEYLR